MWRSGPSLCGIAGFLMMIAGCLVVRGQAIVYLNETPNYSWAYGCVGTATGNLFGFWDRNGLTNFYTGTAGGGLAPLDDHGANVAIRSMWASAGHIYDYGDATALYESTAPDPYIVAGRTEHTADCIGDFIGLSQRKWTNMNDECDGNINAYCFVYWDKFSNRRTNYQPTNSAGQAVTDVQSGLRAWSQFRGYEADVFTQLTSFNPTIKPGKGFAFADLKHEIDSGYPVLLFLQDFTTYSRTVGGVPKMNPPIHGMLAYGYEVGSSNVYYRTSWASTGISEWNSSVWQAGMPVRGVIGYHPKPRITKFERNGSQITLYWDGPLSKLVTTDYDGEPVSTNQVHRYVVEQSSTLDPNSFSAISAPLTVREFSFDSCACTQPAFFRVRLVTP